MSVLPHVLGRDLAASSSSVSVSVSGVAPLSSVSPQGVVAHNDSNDTVHQLQLQGKVADERGERRGRSCSSSHHHSTHHSEAMCSSTCMHTEPLDSLCTYPLRELDTDTPHRIELQHTQGVTEESDARSSSAHSVSPPRSPRSSTPRSMLLDTADSMAWMNVDQGKGDGRPLVAEQLEDDDEAGEDFLPAATKWCTMPCAHGLFWRRPNSPVGWRRSEEEEEEEEEPVCDVPDGECPLPHCSHIDCPTWSHSLCVMYVCYAIDGYSSSDALDGLGAFELSF